MKRGFPHLMTRKTDKSEHDVLVYDFMYESLGIQALCWDLYDGRWCKCSIDELTPVLNTNKILNE